jgi:hypothetical protein
MPHYQLKPPSVRLNAWQDPLAAAAWTCLEDRDLFAPTDDGGQPWFSPAPEAAGQAFGLALYRGEAGRRFLFEVAPPLAGDPRESMAQALGA